MFNRTYGFSLLTFGFFTAVALLAGVYMFREEAKTTGCDPQRIDGLCVWMLIAAIFGARIFFFIHHPEALAAGVLEIFRIWNGGVSLPGGAVAAAAVGFGYTRSFKMPILRTLDAFAPAIAIGQFFVWLGCFFSGFCRPVPANSAWDLQSVLTRPDAGAHLHPTALFIAAGHFVIFGLLLLAKQRRRFNGQTFWLYILLFGGLGLAVGTLSRSASAPAIFGLPLPVIINAALIVFATIALLALRRRGRKQQSACSERPNGEYG
jgi:phosphatidylglycerol:prolipoprotein diacylglycerol transferase